VDFQYRVGVSRETLLAFRQKYHQKVNHIVQIQIVSHEIPESIVDEPSKIELNLLTMID
jgi:hypothetical protein